METFNYPYSVASNKPMQSFGILDRSNTPISNPFKGFTNLFDANPNMPGVQIFNNPKSPKKLNRPNLYNQLLVRNNLKDYQGRSPLDELRFGYNNVFNNKGSNPYDSRYVREDLLTNRNFSKSQLTDLQKKNIRDKSYTDNNLPIPNKPIFINNTNEEKNIEPNNRGILNFNTEEEYLKASGLLNQQGTQKENVTNNKPEEKPKMTMQGLLDKAVQFATSDFGRDFFMNIDDDYSLKPKSFLSRISDGYNVAKANEREREKLRIDELKTKNFNYKEPVYRALVRDKNGNQYGLFSSGGKLYADVNGKRIPQTELEKEIGPYDIRNVGDQMDGVISLPEFRKVNKEIIDDEISLNKYVKFLQEVDKSGVGYERLINNFTAKMKTFFSTKSKQYGLTEEELAQQIANGNLQGLLGSSRKEVVGGGVLTEQDARRVIEYLGGDVSAFNNPARVQDAISVVFRDKYEKYLNNLNDYNIGVQNEYGTRGYKSKEQIKFTEPQLELLDAGITVEMGLRNFDNLSQEELLAIDPNNLSIEKYNQYIQALERFVE